MKVKLAYGKNGLIVDLPSKDIDIIEPSFVEGIKDEGSAILQALQNPVASPPLRQLADSDASVAVIFPDRTRAMPSRTVLPILLSQLNHIPKKQITLINAVGTHRPNTEVELNEMLGENIVQNYRIVQHQPKNRSSMVRLGLSKYGNEVWVNKAFVQGKLKNLIYTLQMRYTQKLVLRKWDYQQVIIPIPLKSSGMLI